MDYRGQYSLKRSSSELPPAAPETGENGPPGERTIRIEVLGPLRVWNGDREITPRAPKVLQVLSLLILRRNQNVHTEVLMQELWGDNLPRSALTTIQTYVYQIRRLLGRERVGRHQIALLTRTPGYQLRIAAGAVDLHGFLELSRHGRTLLDRGRPEEAAVALRAALELWTDEPLANVRLGSQLFAYVVDLQEQHRSTLRSAIEADVARGQHRQLSGELRALIAMNPLDGWLHGQLMVVLERNGRRSDALKVFHDLRDTLG